MKSNATAQQVADLAQVSQSAVSRTFTAGASVSAETRRRVLDAAKTLGYRPNAIVRILITRRSRIIALMVSYLENQFYPLVIEHLSQKLQKQGYHVLMSISDMHEADGVLHDILQYQVDGIVMASTTLSVELTVRCTDCGADRAVQPRARHEHRGQDKFTGGSTREKTRKAEPGRPSGVRNLRRVQRRCSIRHRPSARWR